jgi:uncharacterized membrane protein YidH (DUF202 family)
MKPRTGLGTVVMLFGVSIAAWGVIHRNDPLTPVMRRIGGPSQSYIPRSWPVVAIMTGVCCVYLGYRLFMERRR